MNRILFSHSYFMRFDPKQWTIGLPYAPLGTLYAAALMRENGYHVSLFDTMFSKNADELLPQLEKHHPDFFVIYDDGFNYLTKMCLTNMREAAFRMIKLAKKTGSIVIVSSSDSTDHYKKYLHAGADFVLMGEAELTLLELINSFRNGNRDFSNIQGLAYESGVGSRELGVRSRESGVRSQESGVVTQDSGLTTQDSRLITKTPARPVIKHLDSLPYPAWDLVDIEAYRSSWLNNAGYFSMNMGTTRGCPYKCNWCAKPIYGNRYNSRSPENVVQELKILKNKFHFDHIWFCDDIFGLKPGWVREFADLIQKENFQFKFKIQARADLVVQEHYVKDLARAGCDNAWIGAESGSQKILDAMDKGTSVTQIYEATRLLRAYGIKPSFFIQFGYPGETKEDIDKTIGMINDLLPHEIGISVSYPLPGTKFYERVRSDMKEKTNWTDSDELQLMFKNTYPPRFYKQLHRYVHKSYRKHLALENIKRIFSNPAAITLTSVKKAASVMYYLPSAFLAKRKLHSLEQ